MAMGVRRLFNRTYSRLLGLNSSPPLLGVLVLGLAFLSAGCTENYRPEDHYDPTAKQIAGTISTKRKIDLSEANKAYFSDAQHTQRDIAINTVALTPGSSPEGVVLGVIFINLLGIGPGRSYETPYTFEYTMETNNKQRIMLLHPHSGFEVGDCVTVFISEDAARYPATMAYGGGCTP